MFHGRIPYFNIDLKMGIRPQQAPISTSQLPQFILNQTEMICQDVRKNAMQAYIKYEAFYDKKANASNQTSRICLCLTAESRSSREQNSFYGNSVDWALHYLKSVIEQKLFGTQNWHQEDASASSYAIASVHTPTTPTRCTNHATRMET